MSESVSNKGIQVTMAGTGINLALGILYTWSIFKGAIKQSIASGAADAFHWSPSSLNDPYAICCIVFACMMIAAGKIQDRFGPGITAAIGGVLVAAGFVWISTTTDYIVWVLGFGVLAGTGIAFGYSAATPAALKWFHPSKTGRVSGIVVAGFGLASVYIAPLAQYLLATRGIQGSMFFFGIAFLIVVSVLSLFLKNPPDGYSASGDFACKRAPENETVRKKFQDTEAQPAELLRTPFFWMLWALYFIGAGAGLMVIGSVAGMAKASMGKSAFIAVAIMAIGNAGGRIAAGMLSDKIGRKKTLFTVFSFQTALMFIAILLTGSTAANPVLIVLLATMIGFNYGANLALFPSYAKDLWGMKHFGVNYGLLFTAWGFGGLVMSRLSESLAAKSGSFMASFIAAGCLLAAGSVIIYFMHDRKEELRQEMRRLASQAAVARM
jgi:OFA family oxalate/formate antiporter-like MFS transporter